MEVTTNQRAITGSPASSRAKSRGLFITVLILGAVLSLLYLNQTSDVAATGYDIADLQAQQQMLSMQNEQLRLQIAQLESLDRIDREATTRLHMGPPGHVVYVPASAAAIPTPLAVPTPTQVNSPSPAAIAWQWAIDRIASLNVPQLPGPFPKEAGSG